MPREPEATLGAIFGLIVIVFLLAAFAFTTIMVGAHFGWFGMEITYP